MRPGQEKGLITLEAALFLPLLLLILIFLIGGLRAIYRNGAVEGADGDQPSANELLPTQVIRGTDLALDLGDQLKPWLPQWLQ